MINCWAEMCQYWTGFGCACETMGLDPPLDRDAEPCNPCGHARASHEDGLQKCSECDCPEWWK